MGTVDVDAKVAKAPARSYSWSVSVYGIADSEKAAREAARSVVDAAKGNGLRSGNASAPGLRADLTSAGIVPRPETPDPTSEEAVQGVPYVKNTPLGSDGLPDPAREVKSYKPGKPSK